MGSARTMSSPASACLLDCFFKVSIVEGDLSAKLFAGSQKSAKNEAFIGEQLRWKPKTRPSARALVGVVGLKAPRS